MSRNARTSSARAVDLDWSEQERRQYERHAVSFYLRAVDVENDTALGDLVDISEGGFKLIGTHPAVPGQRMLLSLDYRLETGHGAQIEVEARCVWIGGDEVTGLNAVGFAFCEPSPATSQKIAELISGLAA